MSAVQLPSADPAEWMTARNLRLATRLDATGPDPAEVARRMEAMAADYAKFKKANAKSGPQAKNVVKMRAETTAPAAGKEGTP